MLDLFKSFTLNWWQASIFKLGMAAAGVLLGIYFTSFFKRFKLLLWILAVAALGYITIIWFKQ